MTQQKFTKTNLRVGLKKIVTQSSMQKRADNALKLYDTAVEDGVPHRTAIDLALRQASKGLKDEKKKLRKAREAAGITPGARIKRATQPIVKPVTDRLNKTTTTTKKEQETSVDENWSFHPGVLIFFIAIGALIGILVGFNWLWEDLTWPNVADNGPVVIVAVFILVVGFSLTAGIAAGVFLTNLIRGHNGYTVVKKETKTKVSTDASDLDPSFAH